MVIMEIPKPSPRIMFTQSRKLFESVIWKKGEMKIDHPNVFLGGSVKSPLLWAIPRKTYPKVSSDGRTVKSTVYSFKPKETVAIKIKQKIIQVFCNKFSHFPENKIFYNFYA